MLNRKFCTVGIAVSAMVGGALLWWPEHSRLSTLIWLVVWTSLILCSIGFVWRITILRRAAMALVALLIFIGIVYHPPFLQIELQKEMVEDLKVYMGTKYVWGGEGPTGIDCSGLVRRGLINALVAQGLKQFNLSLLRDAAHLWWNDFSAKDMGLGLGGWLTRIDEVERLNEFDPRALIPGDIAVTKSGVHVLQYLGDGEWIQADPKENKVTITKMPDSEIKGWFWVPVRILRWKYFTQL